ncbi:hypothetical protein MNU24_07975 [Spiroplasma poulsonii]|uniref:hypothetical protein n=1 Tax=Spiroplasma poulsonii TaxID=2138 RepID=UPI001F4D277B|nr:hypothetical protein [Spiroplasma poulsonii]UNF61840.1 hypothetical protein MNU24_07975 [Spiroplasma poulsonii]
MNRDIREYLIKGTDFSYSKEINKVMKIINENRPSLNWLSSKGIFTKYLVIKLLILDF